MKLLFTLSFLALVVSAISASAAPSIKLQPLVADQDFASGCGCSVGTMKGEEFSTLLFSEYGNGSPAIVKVNGRRLSLPFVSSTEKEENPQIGDRFTKVYSDGKLKITLDHETNFVCGPQEEECEVTGYKVDAVLERGNVRTELKSLEGDCGC